MDEKSCSLIVEVLKASNLPKHKSKPDPFVSIILKGIFERIWVLIQLIYCVKFQHNLMSDWNVYPGNIIS